MPLSICRGRNLFVRVVSRKLCIATSISDEPLPFADVHGLAQVLQERWDHTIHNYSISEVLRINRMATFFCRHYIAIIWKNPYFFAFPPLHWPDDFCGDCGVFPRENCQYMVVKFFSAIDIDNGGDRRYNRENTRYSAARYFFYAILRKKLVFKRKFTAQRQRGLGRTT